MNKLRRITITSLLILQLSRCLYPSYGKVVKVDRKQDTITIRDTYGYTWVWEGAEDWSKGDHVALLMYDNHTPNKIKDDRIIKLRYVG